MSKRPKKKASGRVTEPAALAFQAIQADAWIPAAEFKARCLDLMDQVHDQHREFVITKHGKPVATLTPFDREPPDIVGFMKGTVLSHGDLVSPVGEPWNAER